MNLIRSHDVKRTFQAQISKVSLFLFFDILWNVLGVKIWPLLSLGLSQISSVHKVKKSNYFCRSWTRKKFARQLLLWDRLRCNKVFNYVVNIQRATVLNCYLITMNFHHPSIKVIASRGEKKRDRSYWLAKNVLIVRLNLQQEDQNHSWSFDHTPTMRLLNLKCH